MNEEPQTPKIEPKKLRARASKLFKRAAKKLAEIPEEFVDRALRRLGEQLNATKPMWSVVEKKMINIPDEKIRQDAAIMILAYKWGKPVERSLTAHVDQNDFQAMVAKYAQLERERSLQKTVQGKEIPPTLPEPASDKGGGAN